MVLALPAFLIVQSVFVPAPTMTRGKVPLPSKRTKYGASSAESVPSGELHVSSLHGPTLGLDTSTGQSLGGATDIGSPLYWVAHSGPNPQEGPAIVELHIDGPAELHTEGMAEPPLPISPSAVGPSQHKRKDPPDVKPLDVSTKRPCLDLNDMANALLFPDPDPDPPTELAGLPDLGNPPGIPPPCTFPVLATSSDAFLSTAFPSHCVSTVDGVPIPMPSNTVTYGPHTTLPILDGFQSPYLLLL